MDDYENYDFNDELEESEGEESNGEDYEGTGNTSIFLGKIEGDDRIGVPVMTRFEYARMLETRTQQIDNGSPIGFVLPVGMTDSLSIAEEEIKRGICPLYIGKPVGSGNKMEVFHTRDLELLLVTNMGKSPMQKVLDSSIEEMLKPQTMVPLIEERLKSVKTPIKYPKRPRRGKKAVKKSS